MDYGKYFLPRRGIDSPTGASSTTRAKLYSTSFSRSLHWQPSETSIHPTVYSKGSTTCPTRWASSFGYRPKCDRITWPIQPTFAMMSTHISLTAILLNALTSSCSRLHLGNICHMLPQRNSMMLRNISSHR